MIAEIENKILDWLENAGLGVRATDVTRAESIRKPAAFVYVEAGKMSRPAMSKLKVELDVYVLVAFRSVRDELERRHGLYPILEGVIQGLMLADLDLAVTRLIPERFANITDADFRERDTLVYQILFSTSYVMTPADGEEISDLLRVGLNYYLQDPEDDDVADASDLVEFEEE